MQFRRGPKATRTFARSSEAAYKLFYRRRQGAPSPRAALQNGGYILEGDTLKQKVQPLEKTLVKEALARHRWDQSKVARELGLSRVGLANKIRR
jgi:transcriptional regulator with PAS, ATPase and Fis domain